MISSKLTRLKSAQNDMRIWFWVLLRAGRTGIIKSNGSAKNQEGKNVQKYPGAISVTDPRADRRRPLDQAHASPSKRTPCTSPRPAFTLSIRLSRSFLAYFYQLGCQPSLLTGDDPSEANQYRIWYGTANVISGHVVMCWQVCQKAPLQLSF